MISQALQERTLLLCRALIGAQSLSGAEEAAVARMEEAFEQLGYDRLQIDRYGSIIGTIQGNRPGPHILLDAHIDTVPVDATSAWQHPPFAGEVAEGKLYGRGTSDMKGALAAMTVAAAAFSCACSIGPSSRPVNAPSTVSKRVARAPVRPSSSAITPATISAVAESSQT